jgi:hypothetical protein
MKETLARWHQFVATKDVALLNEILAENVRLHSPFVWKPKEGRAAAIAILSTVMNVFEDFHYVREIAGERDLVLEFAARIGDLQLRGVDLITFDDDGLMVDFEVMVRPGNALMALAEQMRARLDWQNLS